MILDSVSNTAMERAFSALWQRQQVISHNIANEDTPGYKARRLSFESELQGALSSIRRQGTSRRDAVSRVSGVSTREYSLNNIASRADGNNVDLDNEYIEMARVQMQYNALEQRINSHYSNLKYAISSGR